ncbi:LacI family DNA-binding transcriptional regulator [Frankia sp. AgB1.9]|uniref:LacI family DNA-binding transcriptional regulator n=1 Tax=unclassified Frankia TaxID=2632575 RepID=UPI001933B92D|nr:MULTISPECIES: LacI family DNA-binding transcriptional regulator [unclassified Frankia]MBL7493821.1 LacI family DNA-binding transcriptional regulator [Frankia sp. AgW1.1]MBL7550488.1 LacI family DNA-binding transcriptional regulator [Frankia sp. AgB1.9]MBL7624314.1 LacI family DNA-binding transcriptional regulator [Frankia sp. AgB1.8]
MSVSDATARRRVTASDVAKAAGVSRATVGFVLNQTPGQTISERTRARVIEASVRLGYRPNGAAQVLASGRSRIVVLVVPDWPIEFRFRAFLDEASLALDEAGYSLVTHFRHPHGPTRRLWETVTPDLVVGIAPFTPDDLASLRACGVKRILPDQTLFRPAEPDTSLASIDGPRLQVEHLRERGHERLGYAVFDEPRLSSLVTARHGAACTHAAALGLPALDLRCLDYRDRATDEVVRGWHEGGLTGIAAYNDDVAAAVVGAALRLGLRVPEDLAVVGHDDSPIATIMVPALSSIHFDSAALGRHFAALALSRVNGRPLPAGDPPANVTLIQREST